jgi:subtilisin family serine protease
MASAPQTLNHPTFGPCKLVPAIVAIRWSAPLDPQAVRSALSANSLAPAAQAPSAGDGPRTGRGASRATRDPRAVNVNQSETLTFASGASGRAPTDTAQSRLAADPNVQWIGPVYRANSAESGPQSYFAINPTVLLLTQEAGAAVGDVRGIDDSVSIDQNRSRLLKGYIVLNLPNANAIDVARQIGKTLDAAGVANGILFENIPYISPLCGCSCGETTVAGVSRGRCSPSQVAVTPNDTFYPNQWGLQRINAPRAWPISEGDPNVVIAVLDQGVELGHPDLSMWPLSYSTVTHTNNGSPVGNHGTACAGIIGARIDNALGVSGLAGKCRVMAIATNFADTEVAEGLYFAADNGARVVSMSFGVYPSWMMWNFAIIEAALQYCHDKSVVLVAASGNENINQSRFPGSDPRTICVGGSNRDDKRKSIGDTSVESWWGACYGPALDVVAPCLEIPTTDRLGAAGYTPTDYDMTFNGTSSATPHVAGLAGLIISVDPALSNTGVRQIILETTDKINIASYPYLPTGGKPYGTWNNEVGYGRINAERALLVACSSASVCKDSDACCVDVPMPDACCVSPCDPPWRPDEQCLVWYETRLFRVPIARQDTPTVPRSREFAATAVAAVIPYIEFRITYEHRMCLLGKQHGPLLFTVTLLPGEKVTLYHSERYRRITSEQDRYSIQTTFMQFLSSIHQARVTDTLNVLVDTLASVKGSASVSVGGGLGGLLGLPSGGTSTETTVTDHNVLQVGHVSDQFNQSVTQASQLTQAERSVVVSTYEDKETADITSRVIQNDNVCRAVTYFVRKVVELYAFSTRVSDISYRIIAPNVPSDWHSVSDLGWLPVPIQNQIKAVLKLLPQVGDIVERPKPVSIPTDGTVYDPELAHCCSCEPERAAAITIQLEKQKAEALKACLEAQVLELELQRRRMLLQKGELAPFDTLSAAAALPAPAP